MKASGNLQQFDGLDPLRTLSERTREQIDHWVAKFPPERKRSALIQALTAAQEQNGGWISDPLVVAVARYLELPEVWAFEVVSFYSMFSRQPVGRHKISICTNISCMLRGSDAIVAHVEQRLGIALGGTSADGRVTLIVEEECLAACCGAPMMVVDGHYHENLTPERCDEILDSLE